MLALLGAGFAISSALRLRTEEGAGRAEPILAAPIGRPAWLASHLLVATVGTLIVIAAGGLGTGLAYGYVLGDAGQAPRMVGVGTGNRARSAGARRHRRRPLRLVPRFALAAWAGLAVAVLVDLFGELLRLPQWSRALSPLHHAPAVPAEELRFLPLTILTLVAAELVVIGAQGFRSRDLRTG